MNWWAGWTRRAANPGLDAVVECPTRAPFNGCGRRRWVPVEQVSRTGRWPECCGQVMEMTGDVAKRQGDRSDYVPPADGELDVTSATEPEDDPQEVTPPCE